MSCHAMCESGKSNLLTIAKLKLIPWKSRQLDVSSTRTLDSKLCKKKHLHTHAIKHAMEMTVLMFALMRYLNEYFSNAK